MTTRSISIIHRSFFVLLIMAMTFGMVGCGSTTVEPQPAPTSAVTEVPTTVPTETPVPTPTQTPFVPKANIKIVVHVPLSGDSSDFGTDIEHAAELAVQQLAGPVNELGYKIELVPYDDERNVATAVSNAKELVADAEVLCGVGHFNSAIMLQASEIYHKAGLPFVSPSTTDPTVTDRGYLEINRVSGRGDVQGMAGAQFSQAQGFTRVFIISNNIDYFRKIADYFKREANSLNLKVVGSLATDKKDKFDSMISKVMAANADLVYFAGWSDQAGEFFREARAANYAGAFLGPDTLDTPDLVNRAGPLLVDGGAYYTVLTVPANAYRDAAQFVQDFQTHYGAAPLQYAAQAYDAAGICLAAIREASQAKNGELPTRKEVANAIRALKDYKGITGTYNFNKKGDPTLSEYFIYKVVSVDPNQWAQNTPVTSFKIAPPK